MLASTLSMVLDYLVLREIFSPSKGDLIGPSSVVPEPERESRSHAQAQLSGFGVGAVLRVLDGCARAHPPHVAPEPVGELNTRSRAFKLQHSRCSLGMFCGVVVVIVVVAVVVGDVVNADEVGGTGISTACGCCRLPYSAGIEASCEWASVSPGHACVWANVLLTRWA
jgi:hypothetical protein